MHKPEVNDPKVAGGILFEIEAHLAPLGWFYEDLYENPDLLKSLSDHLYDYRMRDWYLSSEECRYGIKYYKEEEKRLDLFVRRMRGEDCRRDFYNTSRRRKDALKALKVVRGERIESHPFIVELKEVIAALKNGNPHLSRLPSCYSEEALLP